MCHEKCKLEDYRNNCTSMMSVFGNLVIACEDKMVNALTNIKWIITFFNTILVVVNVCFC